MSSATGRKKPPERLKMLENMHRLLEKIDSLNKSFSAMAPRKGHRQQQTFANAMNAATKQEVSVGAASMPAADLAGNIKTDVNTLIEKYSMQHGLQPDVVRQLIVVASKNNPQAVGANGNLGLMQLQPQVFRESGYDDPFDPEQNIMAGTQHLSNMLQRNGGSLPLALAAYNTDPATVKRFGGVPPFADTQSFVGQILTGLGKTEK